MGEGSWAWSLTASSAVRASCTGPLRVLVELVITNGGWGSAAPGWVIAIIASTESRSGSPSSSARAPAAPAALPLVEASTNVLARSRLPSASASSIRTPVAAALLAAPTPALSRVARRRRPCSRRRREASAARCEARPPHLELSIELLLGDGAGGNVREPLGHQVGDGVVAGAARLPVGSELDHLTGGDRGPLLLEAG